MPGLYSGRVPCDLRHWYHACAIIATISTPMAMAR